LPAVCFKYNRSVREEFQFEQVLAFEPGRAVEIFAGIPAAAGVFALFGHGEVDQPYLTRTANLRRRMQRLLAVDSSDTNLQSTNTKRLNLSGRVARVEFTCTGSEFEAMLLLYRAMTSLLGVEAAERRLRLHTPFAVRLAVENAYPRAYVSNKISARNLEHYYGPFPTRAAAERYIDESLNLFKLRRCHEDLTPDPAFPGCVYSEMKMCLAPCFKGCTDERYAEETKAVGEYLATRGGSLVAGIAAAREAASTALDFERAAEMHAVMTRAMAAARLADEIVRPIAKLDAVVVQNAQKASGKDRAALFLVQSGLLAGPVFISVFVSGEKIPEADSKIPEADLKITDEQVAAAIESLTTMLPQEAGKKKISSRLLGCHLALLKRWYYRAEKTRNGEIFFRNEDGKFPMKRIVRAVSRAAGVKESETAKTGETRNGVPLLPVRADAEPVTSEMVRKLDDELH
jgi:hypothetical protein